MGPWNRLETDTPNQNYHACLKSFSRKNKGGKIKTHLRLNDGFKMADFTSDLLVYYKRTMWSENTKSQRAVQVSVTSTSAFW